MSTNDAHKETTMITTDILNSEEIEAVMVLKHLKGLSEDAVRRGLWDVAYDVENFTTSNFRTGHRAADWFLRVAEALSEQTFTMKHSFTMDDVITVVEKAIEDAATEYREFWEDNPIDFAKWHSRAKMGDNGPINHPWGDDEVAILRKWLAVRPYRIWVVQNAVKSAAMDVLDEVMLDMASGNDDASSIGQATKDAFDRVVTSLRKNLIG